MHAGLRGLVLRLRKLEVHAAGPVRQLRVHEAGDVPRKDLEEHGEQVRHFIKCTRHFLILY